MDKEPENDSRKGIPNTVLFVAAVIAYWFMGDIGLLYVFFIWVASVAHIPSKADNALPRLESQINELWQAVHFLENENEQFRKALDVEEHYGAKKLRERVRDREHIEDLREILGDEADYGH